MGLGWFGALAVPPSRVRANVAEFERAVMVHNSSGSTPVVNAASAAAAAGRTPDGAELRREFVFGDESVSRSEHVAVLCPRPTS